ncbi:MAG: 4Fe-4S dicluster domain-containing protein [Desulfomonilaceae bacterium]|nr:4Fe-4S dicluster domain-containing protein [Desulfomonilaceae bacterium]
MKRSIDPQNSDRSRWSGLPCIFDLCLQLHRSGDIDRGSLVASLPGCIGCGACATLCPQAGIEVQDRGHERVILRNGNVVVRVVMEKCRGCGEYHVARVLMEQVAGLVNYPRDVVDKNLCPACKRIALAAALTGNEPDLSRVRVSNQKRSE